MAPKTTPDMPHVKGVEIATAASGERYRGRDDLSLVICGSHTNVAGVFTQSSTAGPAVLWSRKALANKTARAMIVNAGNANVCTGKQGASAVKAVANAAASKVANLDAEQVFVSSTGVIGEQLKLDVVLATINDKISLNAEQNWQDFANAIVTTDTYAKLSCAQINLNGHDVTIVGVAKGSGMIEPNMATMLAYVFTDANVDQATLQKALQSANAKSFNCITVDSDTSTSDTCLLFATGEALEPPLTAASPEMEVFQAGLDTVMNDLAQQVVRDGEGASKFITVDVRGAVSDESAKLVAKSIANSPLVKTTIAGEDANWGRIIMAVGKTNEPIELEKLSVSMGGVVIAAGDGPVDGYEEAQLNKHLSGKNINIAVDLGCGMQGKATVWTCDLTHGYIEINADYRS